MATLTASGVTFGDGTNINGTTLLQVGSIMQLFNFHRTAFAIPGGTNLSTANLGYSTNATTAKIVGLSNGSVGLRDGNVQVPGGGRGDSTDTASPPGSWRAITGVRFSVYEGYGNYTTAYPGLFVRVA
jgi:hypothetical protein